MRLVLPVALALSALASALVFHFRESHRSAPENASAPAIAAPPIAAAKQPATDDAPARNYFGDTPLVNQDGAPVRFYTDLIQGKVVVLSSFFASCDGSCPIMAATLERLQQKLGDRLGRDVTIVSISVDAEHDTPAKLKEFAMRFHAKPGWSFLTGDKNNVDQVLKKLGQYTGAPADHSALMLVGNDRTGLWKKVFGLAKSEAVIEAIGTVVDDRGSEPAPGGRSPD